MSGITASQSGFDEARAIFSQPYWFDQRSDVPQHYLAVDWVGDRWYSVIFEHREDDECEIVHPVRLWKSSEEEIQWYEENS